MFKQRSYCTDTSIRQEGVTSGCAGDVRGAMKTSKMKAQQDSKALWAPQTEKPIHYTYETVIVFILNVTE